MTQLDWQRNYAGVRQAALVTIRLGGAAGPCAVWLRDAAGVADVPLPLRLTLRAGDTLPSSCSLLRAAALTTPLRAGDEREVLVQCRDAYGNAAAEGCDAVTLTLTPRGGGGGGVRAAAEALAGGVYRVVIAPTAAALYDAVLRVNDVPLRLTADGGEEEAPRARHRPSSAGHNPHFSSSHAPPPAFEVTAGAPSTLQLRAVSAAAASGWPEREWSDDDSVCIEAGRRLLLHAFALDAYGNRCDRRAAAAALDGLTVTAGRRPDAPPPPPPATPEIVAEGASCKALPPGSGAAAGAVAVRLSLCGGAGPAVLRASSPASGLSGEMEVEVIGGAVAPASCDLDSDGLCIATAGCRAALRLTARDAWGNALDASTLSEAPRLRLTSAAADAADADSAVEDAADFDGSSAFECGPTAAERESAARNARTSARAQPDGSFALAAVVATAGEYNLTISFGRDASPLGPPTRLRVLAGRPQALKLIVPPAAATCGEAWGPLVVFAVDAHGNPVRGAQFSPVVCEAGDDDDGGGAEAAGGGAVASRRGSAARRVGLVHMAWRERPVRAAALTLRLGGSSGALSIKVKDSSGGGLRAAAAKVAIAAGAPHALRLSCFATCAVVGVAFGPLNIQLTDAYGNPLPSADLPLRLTVRRACCRGQRRRR